MKLIDKDAVFAEIDELSSAIKIQLDHKKGDAFWIAQKLLLERLRTKVNTLEVKEVDFEEELKHYCNDYYNCDYPKQLEEEKCSEVMPHIISAAKHFFELGLNASNPLTWEDINEILYAERLVLREFGTQERSNEELCNEVLKRLKRTERIMVMEQPVMLQSNCESCQLYEGFGQCFEHGNNLVENCKDYKKGE